MKDLPRVDHSLVQPVMFIRPRRVDDHTEFEWLLPRCTALFVYADENGRDWVRWSLPKQVAGQLGWDMRCTAPGCGCTEDATTSPQHAYLVDLAYNEISWFIEQEGMTV